MEPFCALSTPAGVSGIAVIRASGEGVSLKAGKAVKILRTTGERTDAALESLGGYESCYARFIDPSTGNTVDDVVVTVEDLNGDRNGIVYAFSAVHIAEYAWIALALAWYRVRSGVS